jgi:hypothetical protein
MDFFVTKDNGKFKNTRKMEDFNRSLPDGRYRISIEPSNKRSGQQNRYYWGLVIPLVTEAFKDLGHELSHEETHEFLKAKFNHKDVVNKETGEVLQVPLSTTRLSKMKFSEYVENIQRFGAMFLNINIPDPGEQMQIDVHL